MFNHRNLEGLYRVRILCAELLNSSNLGGSTTTSIEED